MFFNIFPVGPFVMAYCTASVVLGEFVVLMLLLMIFVVFVICIF